MNIQIYYEICPHDIIKVRAEGTVTLKEKQKTFKIGLKAIFNEHVRLNHFDLIQHWVINAQANLVRYAKEKYNTDLVCFSTKEFLNTYEQYYN